ncbi:hypothetical protein [Streptomyces sp. bgisy153]|uniref:hypothetical protein n=1 Tax=Streptomyces sp. bgisy153 TaxID=3413793 RepID=UPI003D738AE3
MNRATRIGAAAGTVLLLTGAVACGSEKAEGGQRTAAQALTAAFEKTSDAKSAKISMTMSMPKSMEDGGEVTMTGVMGWDPSVMDVTMEGSGLASEPGGPEKVRMIMRDDVMYMDLGDAAAQELDMDGKHWLKMDFGAIAEKSGNEKLAKAMSGGMGEMNQDPAKQLALLLESPNLKHVGSEKIDGVTADHYKGTLSVKEMLNANKSLDVLDADDRKELLANVEKSGIKGYDTDVWVNEDDLPVRMDVGIDSPEGTVTMSMRFSDYGAKAEVTVPPAGETVDFMKMMEDMQAAMSGEGMDEGELGEPDVDLENLENLDDLGDPEPGDAAFDESASDEAILG